MSLDRVNFAVPQITLAADARLSRVDYADDHAWNLVPGTLDSPALALQTRYGGRVGLGSIVPMWTLLNDRRTIYQPQAYAQPPKITAFAPGYAQVEAVIVPELALTADYWAIESHAIGARYTLNNTGTQPLSLRLDLFAQVATDGKTLKLAIVTLAGGLNALSFGEINGIQPAVMLENATAQFTPGKASSPKIGTDLTIQPGAAVQVRFIQAAAGDLRDSLALATSWLAEDWERHFARITQASVSIPTIELGNSELNMAVALSYHQLMQALMKGGGLPHPSLVATRQPASGFSANGEGSDHDRAWSGQPASLAYLTAPVLAAIDPELGKGIVRNFIAVQEAGSGATAGAIDGKPGLAGQRQGSLAVPILARMTLALYQITQDRDFVGEVLPALVRFYDHWLSSQDADGDGLPEWLNERQSGYVYFPTFGTNNTWAQNADIRYVESPDLAAYLLSEAVSLSELASVIGDSTVQQTTSQHAETLKTHLDSLWHEDRYAYRDRDSHTVAAMPTLLIEDGRADEAQVIASDLTPPSRLLVRITGGTSKPPRLTLHFHGTGMTGAPIHETASSIGWYRGYGVYVSENVFQFIDRIEVEGLSRVYRVDVQTVDLSRLDINALLPLWANATDKAEALVKLLTAPALFWQPNGASMTAANDPAFDSAQNGGIWLFSLSLIGEGLLKHNHTLEAAEILQRIMTAQAVVLRQDGHFHEFYHSALAQGSGESGHLAGIVPLSLLHQALGVWIVSPSRVMAGGTLAWNREVNLKQHGVEVTRSATGTKVVFASGHTVELPADAPYQAVIDPQPAAIAASAAVSIPAYPEHIQPSTGKIVIQVEIEKDVAKIKPESDGNA